MAQTKHGRRPAATIGGDRLGQPVGPHGVALVDLDQAEVVAAQAGDAHPFLDRRMGLGRGVGHQRAVGAGQVALAAGGPLAGGQDRAERGRRGAVLDHAAAGGRRFELRRQGRACRPANRARAFPAPCRRDWSPRACPARPARPRAARPGSTGRNCSRENRRRSWATASA